MYYIWILYMVRKYIAAQIKTDQMKTTFLFKFLVVLTRSCQLEPGWNETTRGRLSDADRPARYGISDVTEVIGTRRRLESATKVSLQHHMSTIHRIISISISKYSAAHAVKYDWSCEDQITNWMGYPQFSTSPPECPSQFLKAHAAVCCMLYADPR